MTPHPVYYATHMQMPLPTQGVTKSSSLSLLDLQGKTGMCVENRGGWWGWGAGEQEAQKKL